MINNMNGQFYPNQQYGMPGYQTMVNNKLATAMNNVLTEQQRAELKQDVYSIQLTPQELLKNICNHKNNGAFTLRKDPTRGEGYMICNICGSSVKIIDDEKPIVEANVEYTKNIIETIQTLGVELGENYLKEIGKMKSMILLLPRMHEVVMKTWYEKYAQSSMNTSNASSNSAAIFNYMTSGGQVLYNPNIMQQNLMNNGMGFNGQPIYPGQQQMNMNYQQPYYGNGMMGQQQMSMGMQTPMGYQPQMQMNMNYPNNNMCTSNGFFSNAQPQQQGYSQPPTNINQQVQNPATTQVSQSYQGPSAASTEKTEDKAIASKPVAP